MGVALISVTATGSQDLRPVITSYKAHVCRAGAFAISSMTIPIH